MHIFKKSIKVIKKRVSHKVILQMIINSNDPGDMIPLRYLPESKSEYNGRKIIKKKTPT